LHRWHRPPSSLFPSTTLFRSRSGRAIEVNLRIERAAGHTEAQRLETEHAVVEQHMGVQIADRQLLAVHDALADEAHVGIHRTPRSEEHTSELQSRENIVCSLL